MKVNRLQVLILLTVLAVIVILAKYTSTSNSSVENVRPAPQFSLANLDGKNVSLKDFADKVMVVDFWATWCGPCREEIPHLNKLYENYRGKGLVVVGISMDAEGPEVVKQFAKELRMEYPVVMGDENVQQDFGGIVGLPTTFIIDRKGNIVKKYTGYQPAIMQDIEQTIKELM
ncbi:MAG: TlpA family protein disulfide reductase [Acidobacteria bacterium]|nr:MAG: TlpA family protein disulfide reductase [Acidobacteriota bacterium]